MRPLISISLCLALLGCPTPPEGGTAGGGGGGGGNNQPAGGSPPPPPMASGAGNDVQPVQDPGDVDTKAAAGTYTVAGVPKDELPQPDDIQPDSDEAQSQIKEGDHVMFTGEIVCSDCSGTLVLRIAPFVPPSEDGQPGSQVPLDDFRPPPFQLPGAGPFNMAVPKYDGKVVLEVLDDRDGNGRPSQGEKFTVLHRQGTLTAGKNQSGLKVDFSALPSAPGAPGGGAAGGPPPLGAGAAPPGGPPPGPPMGD